MRRELRTVQEDRTVGAVVVEGNLRTFEGQAASVLSGLRRRVGDDAAADTVMAEGWSNGYLYFAEATP